MKKGLQYFIGFTFMLGAISGIISGQIDYLSGFIVLVGGLVCFPPTRNAIERKYQFEFSRVAKYAIVFIGWSALGNFQDTDMNENTQNFNANNAEINTLISSPQSIKSNNDSLKQLGITNMDNFEKKENTSKTTNQVGLKTKDKSKTKTQSNQIKTTASTPTKTKSNQIKTTASTPTKTKSNQIKTTASTPTKIQSNQIKTTAQPYTGYGKSNTSGSSGYLTGKRGGCYYINKNGNKTYVDRSYCR